MDLGVTVNIVLRHEFEYQLFVLLGAVAPSQKCLSYIPDCLSNSLLYIPRTIQLQTVFSKICNQDLYSVHMDIGRNVLDHKTEKLDRIIFILTGPIIQCVLIA